MTGSRKKNHGISRRQFVQTVGITTAAAMTTQACRGLGLDPTSLSVTEIPTELSMATKAPTHAPTARSIATPESMIGQVALVQTDDRSAGVRQALDILATHPAQGKQVFLKPNYNSDDPAPGSTHPDVLRAFSEWLWETGAESITVGDRAGMGDTRKVMERVGIFELADEFGFETVVFDDLGPDDWVALQADHWSRGFALAQPVAQAESVVQACCLKTHRFGGHFTLSLKNSVGMVAKKIPGDGYDYMNELHRSPDQRRMIAEINAAYAPDLVVLDGVEAFTTGGPDRGRMVQANVVLAGADRVALDAVGVAILRHLGTTPEVSSGPIFEQEQIARAVELGLGASSPEEIEFVTDDPGSAEFARLLEPILLAR